MELLRGAIQPYAWGSKTALAGLLGHTPSGRPEAELWLGAHPVAPGQVGGRSLLEHIARDPLRALGDLVHERFGPRLPFLLKILAVDEPLSLQVHPSAAQAVAGFEREEAAGVPLTGPRRNYKDRSAKPELIVALTRFDALCGFRTPDQMVERLAKLDCRDLRSTVQMLEGWPDAVGVQGVVHGLLGMNDSERRDVMAQVTRALARVRDEGDEYALALELTEKYPGDVGALLTLLLNRVTLEPGQGLYLSAGNLHAYLKGVGVEVMASSDNVLRGGLTPKHVDVPELLATLAYELGPVPLVSPRRDREEEVWDTPAAEFRLSRLSLAKGAAAPVRRGPEILLCTDGEAEVQGVKLKKGSALWLDAADPGYAVTGRGTVYRVTAGVDAPARTKR
ncbi:MAG: mannose-6-phosphate isomerase, class I [Myxococcaceae bacterium]|nr:mannose-6-phosphate isomerase, class I [Myxococcaceae bacterium]